MSDVERHVEILECIKSVLTAGTNDPHLFASIDIADYDETESPSYGITISPLGEKTLIGTNERDDIEYVSLVTRTVHATGDDDLHDKSRFRNNLRILFHNKRLLCPSGCHMYSRIDFGNFAIPEAWKRNNNSVTAMRVYHLVRESRTYNPTSEII